MEEVLSMRTEYGKAYQTEDGHFRSEISMFPIHFQKADGNWYDIDTTIVNSTTPNVAFDVFFDNHLDNPNAISMYSRAGITKFHLGSYGIKGHEIPSESAPVEFSGNKATYQFPWGKIIYEVLINGLKEVILIEYRDIDDPTIHGIPIEDACVCFNFNLPPHPFEGELFAHSATGRTIDVERTSEGVKIPYLSYARASLPITIDPTIFMSAGNFGTLENGSILMGGINAGVISSGH